MNNLIGIHPARRKWTLANMVGPDQMTQNVASYQGLHCLHLGQESLSDNLIGIHPARRKWTLANMVGPDQMTQNVASYQGLHCLHLGQESLSDMVTINLTRCYSNESVQKR